MTAVASVRDRSGALLACGVVAGPFYVVVAVLQIVTREGFDITRHPVSILSNGAMGWVQVGNFLIAGLLTIAFAAGMGRGWASRLIALYGAGVAGAGVFSADPMGGFPIGATETVSWHGMMHFVVGGVGFLGLIGACLVMARAHAAEGRRGWAAYSAVTGVFFLAAFVGIASGSSIPGINLAFAAAVVAGWAWITLTAQHLR
ncbi:DUF998 domain-containing protein [Nonomuraea sp. NPDC050556]|uniref:DUF998 domain-containing protein n=1 Tax=Nonomuraea sp. NPDC050556 TaxID=3364369 RepID=UPI00379E2714